MENFFRRINEANESIAGAVDDIDIRDFFTNRIVRLRGLVEVTVVPTIHSDRLFYSYSYLFILYV